ncbi:DUF4166 domain-containing protein [Aestuariivirga sp.]|uniref:DUF4166 domain-containing protein n=1 Tax=Aestuariivirga sp. TaxID=2650926 RepID=UPI0039E55CBB
MIIGASGVFGSRLAEQLSLVGGHEIILAGRDVNKAAQLLNMLQARKIVARFVAFDRTHPDAAQLRDVAPDVAVDAAGPFQHGSLALPEACIAAGVNYLDIADARDFVGSIRRLDAASKAAKVFALSGASSTPALSHAVIDKFTEGWQRRDAISVAIMPGNRTPRGLSVVQAILSYVGRPVRVFREGRWQEAAGWSLDEKFNLPGLGTRHAALCDTPDLDLLAERYAPRARAEFRGGLELGILHHGLRALSWLRSKGLLPFAERLARPLRAIAESLDRFGTDAGGMVVEVSGRDAKDRPVRLRWSLVARDGIGPNIPILPALALIERLASVAPGARPAAGEIGYNAILNHLNRLGIETHAMVEDSGPPFQFQKALGAAWQGLPAITRAIHTVDLSIILQGEAEVEGARTAIGRVIAKAFGFPEGAANVPVRVVSENDGVGERWARIYPTRTMRSYMTNADPAAGTIEEHMGPFRFVLKLAGTAQGIDLVPVRVFWHSLPLPLWLLPAIDATERASADGRHLFDVRVSLRPFGLLVHYKGWLRPVSGA